LLYGLGGYDGPAAFLGGCRCRSRSGEAEAHRRQGAHQIFLPALSSHKGNGQRTRNRPFHAPDKWELFKRYNARDVEAEMGIQQKLSKFPVPPQVWEEYDIDQEINDRGVRIDMELVEQAIADGCPFPAGSDRLP
jgi:hypothetical protein